MKDLQPANIDRIKAHLQQNRTGVAINLQDMLGKPDDYQGARGVLTDADLTRIFLWFEFGKHTKNESCQLPDLLDSIRSDARVRSFMDGQPDKARDPLDLRTATGFEVTFMSDDPHAGLLVGIDGNHRLCAQYLRFGTIEAVPVFVCHHPRVAEWPYVPQSGKQWNLRRRADAGGLPEVRS